MCFTGELLGTKELLSSPLSLLLLLLQVVALDAGDEAEMDVVELVVVEDVVVVGEVVLSQSKRRNFNCPYGHYKYVFVRWFCCTNK